MRSKERFLRLKTLLRHFRLYVFITERLRKPHRSDACIFSLQKESSPLPNHVNFICDYFWLSHQINGFSFDRCGYSEAL